MANRRAHKKLRSEIRVRMARTGESYQKARARILAQRAARSHWELVPFTYFGLPATLAIIEQHGHVLAMCLPSSTLWGRGYPDPLRVSRLWTALRGRGVQ